MALEKFRAEPFAIVYTFIKFSTRVADEAVAFNSTDFRYFPKIS